MSLQRFFWSDEQPWRGLRDWMVPRAFRVAHSALMSTLRVSTSGVHRMAPYIDRREERGALFVLWHDQTLFPLYLFAHADIATMLSTSRNGRLWAGVWKLYGWPIIWGSTNKRAGVLATRDALTRLRAGQSVGFTPDGPKGPRHQAHAGVVYLASKAPAVVMPVAYSASDAWVVRSWDRYLIPKPGAHLHFHVGAPIEVPPNLAREQTEQWQLKIADALNESERVARREVEARAGRVVPLPDLQASRA